MSLNRMKISKFPVLLLLSIAISETAEKTPNPWTPTSEMIEIEGYRSEEHSFQTSDGYVLKNYRIPGNKNGFDPNLYPVVLFHGMATSGKDFLLMRNRSLAFLLADAGYDVWLPNMRFTEDASHINISKDDNEYWDFGIEDSAKIDIPESIEDILRITNSKKIIYIGLSLGNSLYVISCNLKPDVVDKIAIQISLGPAFYGSKTRSQMKDIHSSQIIDILYALGQNHFTISEEMRDIALRFCDDPFRVRICYDFLFGLTGEDWDNIDLEDSPLLFGRSATYVLKQYMHLVQIGATGNFRRYDYGPIENMIRYGTETAPMYNMKACTAPMLLYYGKNDKLVSLKDMRKLLQSLKGSKNKIYVRRPKWKYFNHADYIIGKDATDILYRDIILFLKKHKF